MLNLRYVRVFLGEDRMAVVLGEPPKEVEFRWNALDSRDVPPDHWYDTVLQEVEYQRSQDQKKALGLFVPGE